MSEVRYTINRDGVAHEVLEGDAILINFKTGSYYSLDGLGGAVWERLCAGPVTVASLTTALAAGLDVTADVLATDLQRFVDDLAKEDLIAPTDDALVAPAAAVPPALPYAAPVLGKYTDLEALLLLDPIHDVVVSGWPNARQTQA